MARSKAFVAIAVTVVLTLLFLFFKLGEFEFSAITPLKIREYLLSLGKVRSAFLYVLIYTFSIRPFVPVPPTVYTIAGGFVFGFFWGTVLTVIGATLNASICFYIARLLGRGFVERLFKGKLNRVDEVLTRNGFKALLLIRTSPFGPPFDVVSYVSGVLKVPFKGYVLATALGIVPATSVYSYFGGAITKKGVAVMFAFFMVVALSILLPWFIRRKGWRVGI
jgi:uncharacterized membrane protein YdjX (TVP38/TMEM64 family)